MSPCDMAMSRGDMANCAILFWMLMTFEAISYFNTFIAL